jgi:cytosine/adenosine deaminase-related metal-dependent hydrolase
MEHREDLVDGCKDECYVQALAKMAKYGITTIGATSSYGFDMNALANSAQKVVFFNEVIGSNPAAVDALFGDFKSRLAQSEKLASSTFFPAIAIHSPYAVHPILIKHTLGIAKAKNYVVSTHFMESQAEREWLDKGSGEFKLFFENLLKMDKPVSDAKSFLAHFEEVKTLFIHAVQANESELEMISQMDASIIHCPISNRLLGCGKLDLELPKKHNIPLLIGTDGLSSNFSLSLFNEMRSALMMQSGLDLHLLSRDLLRGSTILAANALNINSGYLQQGRDADFTILHLPSKSENSKALLLNIILHTDEVTHTYINGEEI